MKEAALILFAKENGLWISETDFNKHWADRKIGEGAEQAVYLNNGTLSIKEGQL